jgi:hypothetical protein
MGELEIPEEPWDDIHTRLSASRVHRVRKVARKDQVSKCPTGQGLAWNDVIHGWVFIHGDVEFLTDNDIFRVNREDLVGI